MFNENQKVQYEEINKKMEELYAASRKADQSEAALQKETRKVELEGLKNARTDARRSNRALSDLGHAETKSKFANNDI